MKHSKLGRPLRSLPELPEPVRETAQAFVRAVTPHLKKVRRPRDIKKLLRDPKLLESLGTELAPMLEKLIEVVARSPLPIRSRFSTHLSATLSGFAGPAAANSAELLAIFGSPATLAVSAPTAFLANALTGVWELYVLFSITVRKLESDGVHDPAAIRLALMRILVPDANDFTKAILVRGGRRLAERLLTRTAGAFVPLAGPIFGAVNANINVHRAHQAADSVLQERRALTPGPR